MSSRAVSTPQKLQPGDCIGIIAPAGQITETDHLEQGIRILQEMGFEVKEPKARYKKKRRKD